MWKLFFRMFQHNWEISRQIAWSVRGGSDRVSSSRMLVLHIKTMFFFSKDYVPKIDTMRAMRCCKLPFVTAEGGSQLRTRLQLNLLNVNWKSFSLLRAKDFWDIYLRILLVTGVNTIKFYGYSTDIFGSLF